MPRGVRRLRFACGHPPSQVRHPGFRSCDRVFSLWVGPQNSESKKLRETEVDPCMNSTPVPPVRRSGTLISLFRCRVSVNEVTGTDIRARNIAGTVADPLSGNVHRMVTLIDWVVNVPSGRVMKDEVEPDTKTVTSCAASPRCPRAHRAATRDHTAPRPPPPTPPRRITQFSSETLHRRGPKEDWLTSWNRFGIWFARIGTVCSFVFLTSKEEKFHRHQTLRRVLDSHRPPHQTMNDCMAVPVVLVSQ